MRFLCAVIACWLVHMPAASWADEPYAQVVIRADMANERYPPVTVARPDVTTEQSYDIQRAIVAGKLAGTGDSIAGYKGGLMTTTSQQARGASGPVFGVLLRSGQKTSPARLSLSRYRSMYIECELGFVFSRRIEKPVASVDELRTFVEAVRPVLEVPDEGYVTAPNGVSDLIASNVSAKGFVLGAAVSLAEAGDPNRLEAVLYRDEKRVANGKATNALGNQWNALLATVNLVVRNGYSIEPGHIILTGLIAADKVTSPSSYRANYGDFGELTLTVAP